MRYLLFLLLLTACNTTADMPIEDDMLPEEEPMQEEKEEVQVTAVSVSGSEGSYTFSVTLQSPDTGCEQYADWWEVVDLEGALEYRRVLLHSHVNEQPFSRSGGPVSINTTDEVYIRGHMNNLGYGTQVFKGSVVNGFTQDSLYIDFATDVATQDPLPEDCAF